MERKIAYLTEYDGAHAPCPFCPSLDEPFEDLDSQIPFERTPMKIYTESGDSLVPLNVSANQKIRTRKLVSAPMFINNNYAFIGTRGKVFMEALMRRVLSKWLVHI